MNSCNFDTLGSPFICVRKLDLFSRNDHQTSVMIDHYLVNLTFIFEFIGLVISLFDILEIGDSHLVAGDGASHTRVTFRVLVFRPFIEEIIVGKIKSSNSEGKL